MAALAERLLEHVEDPARRVGEGLAGAGLRHLRAVDEDDAAAELDCLAGERDEALDEGLGRQVGPPVRRVDAAAVARELEHRRRRRAAGRGSPAAARRERAPARRRRASRRTRGRRSAASGTSSPTARRRLEHEAADRERDCDGEEQRREVVEEAALACGLALLLALRPARARGAHSSPSRSAARKASCGNLHAPDPLHALLPFLLALEQLALARDVAAVALCGHVLAQRLHGGRAR